MGLLDIIKNLVGGTPTENLAENENGNPILFEKCLTALLESEKQKFITISGDRDTVVQVAKNGDLLQLNIATYPVSDNPDNKLAVLGIMLPEGSTLGDWEADVYAMYNIPTSATSELATTIDSIFKKLYNNTDAYTISVTLEN